ncbi:hypothetical protein BFS86_19590 [Shewanella algae]|jgi:hypothetical protein|nr:hypothetical protein BFS86_19590 [Shewanella algae]
MKNLARNHPDSHPLTERQLKLRNGLIDFLKSKRGGWFARDRIIFKCGFESMKVDPFGAEFHNAIIRANISLARKGLKIVRSEDGAELYSVQPEGYGR